MESHNVSTLQKRQLERELGMEALDLRLALLIALVVYTIPGLFLVVRMHTALTLQARL